MIASTPTPMLSRVEHHVLQAGELATLIAEFGIGRFESEVAEAAAVAEEHGASPRIARLVTDRTTPDVVRERAFGMMAAHLPNPR